MSREKFFSKVARLAHLHYVVCGRRSHVKVWRTSFCSRLKELPLIPGARIDHVAVAVRDVAAAAPFYIDALGGKFLFAGDSHEQGFRFVQFAYPEGGKIELVTPLSPDSFVARFLERRGEGAHHITFKTDDIETALGHLQSRGVPVMMVSVDRDEWKEAFIHPKDAHGVLVQIAESNWEDEEMARHHLSNHDGQGHRHPTFEELGFSR
ncbi:MAG: VOC family protein [Actinomycetota bacterium]|nr:VOC family protein [Actinomycetota bacterium]